MYLRSAISMIKLVTILLDHHHRNGYWDLQQLITVRNAAQHKLLSLHQSSLDPLTQLCHTVLLVYSDMVIFPLPAVTQFRSRLGTQLHDNLTWVLFQLRSGPPDLHIASGSVLPLYLWAATFGYFAAEHNVPLRDKFRAVVRDFATRLNIVELADFETSLAMFNVVGQSMQPTSWVTFEKPLWRVTERVFPGTGKLKTLIAAHNSEHSNIWWGSPFELSPDQIISNRVQQFVSLWWNCERAYRRYRGRYTSYRAKCRSANTTTNHGWPFSWSWPRSTCDLSWGTSRFGSTCQLRG